LHENPNTRDAIGTGLPARRPFCGGAARLAQAREARSHRASSWRAPSGPPEGSTGVAAALGRQAMRRGVRILVLVAVVAAAGAGLGTPAAVRAGTARRTGDIQVTCEPGLRVLLDGTPAGTSTAAEDGLHLAGVAAGAHVVRVEKDGFAPQTFRVDVGDTPVEVKVQAFVPAALAAAGGENGDTVTVAASAATLHIVSAPQNCVVEVNGVPRAKEVPVLVVAGLAAGSHEVAFSRPGFTRIAATVRLAPGATVTVRGDLKAGKVETSQDGVGALRVVSTPERCTVRFLGQAREKTRSRLNISHVPAGEHRISVAWAERELSTTVPVVAGRRTVVSVSFLPGDEPFVVTSEPE
jgi:hypothetical protein